MYDWGGGRREEKGGEEGRGEERRVEGRREEKEGEEGRGEEGGEGRRGG